MHPDFDEQSNVDFDAVGYTPEDHFYPRSTSRTYLDREETRGNKRKLLAYLRGLAVQFYKGQIEREESYQTKVQLAEMLYPNFYDPRIQTTQLRFVSDGHKTRQIRKLLEKEHRGEVERAISSIDSAIRKQLKEFDNEEQQMASLRNQSLIIRPDETESGAALYAYHGPDFPQPVEILEKYRDWALGHQEKQSAPLRLASSLYKSATNPVQLKLNLDTDFDDQEMDNLENL